MAPAVVCPVLQIQEALKNDMARFQFEGREIKMDPRAGIFITMVSCAAEPFSCMLHSHSVRLQTPPFSVVAPTCQDAAVRQLCVRNCTQAEVARLPTGQTFQQ